MKVAAILVLIFGFSLANPLLKSPESDNYVDQVLENLRQKIAEENLDPAPLPDGEASFSQDIGFITLHGSAKVYDGFFRGLSSIARNGETSFTFDAENGVLALTANIGIGRSTAGYSARAEFQGIGVSASADATIDRVNVYFEANCQLSSCKLELNKFEITEIGNIDVNFHGLGPLDWILGTVVDLVANLIRGFLGDILEGPIKDLLQGILNDLVPDFPSVLLTLN